MKILYEAATSNVEPTSDIVLYSVGDGDNAYVDFWDYALGLEGI